VSEGQDATSLAGIGGMDATYDAPLADLHAIIAAGRGRAAKEARPRRAVIR